MSNAQFWKDRLSQYPNRRKLIHNPSDEDNAYTVQRDEGTVTQEGIAFSADFMNKFDKKIYDVFLIDIDSGGAGATTVKGALQNLGLGSEPRVYGHRNCRQEMVFRQHIQTNT